jgi:diadenosine tetraphosphate (Ap4A) HIT family hydrolase
LNCPLCDRIKKLEQKTYPYLIHEFKHSYLMLGEHQYYAGYSVLVTKTHYREMTDLPEGMREEFFIEMMTASKWIQEVFSPKKMNMCSLGNVVDHMHWHFFPRYQADPQFTNPPWLQMGEFAKAQVTPEEAAPIIKRMTDHIARSHS